MERFEIVKNKLIKIIQSCKTDEQLDIATVFVIKCINNPEWLKFNCKTIGLAIQMQYYMRNELESARKKFYGDDDDININVLIDRIKF